MKKYYLAYGSNLNVQQMKHRCPTARVAGTALIDGYELLFKGSGTGAYLTIEKKEGASVPAAVWEVQEADEAALDRYEGYPSFYYKKDMDIRYRGIRTHRMRKQKAFVYIMHEERPRGIPSWLYVTICLEGYRAFGFDAEMLYDAIEKSRLEVRS